MTELTAYEAAVKLASEMADLTRGRMIVQAIQPGLHPQQRTMAFHQFYGAPIAESGPDREFSHMDDNRVAFRTAFILSEAMELCEKGLGLQVSFQVHGADGTYTAFGSADQKLTTILERAMIQSGRHRNVVEVVDALGDLNVVVNGFAIELGVNMDAIDREVAASNFTKLGADGEPLLGDGVTAPLGKVLKGPNFMEPQIGFVMTTELSHVDDQPADAADAPDAMAPGEDDDLRSAVSKAIFSTYIGTSASRQKADAATERVLSLVLGYYERAAAEAGVQSQ